MSTVIYSVPFTDNIWSSVLENCLKLWTKNYFVGQSVSSEITDSVVFRMRPHSFYSPHVTFHSRTWFLNVNLSLSMCSNAPFPSNRHHRSNDDSLEGKRENYQVCSVQYCVQQLCTVQCTHTWTDNSSLDWVLSRWTHFTVVVCITVCCMNV